MSALIRRSICCAWVFLWLLPDSARAHGHEACLALKEDTIRWLVPSKPGGGYDAYSRLMQPYLEQTLELKIRIQNRPEASGRMAARILSEAPPDGRLVGMVNSVGLMAAQLLEPGSTPNLLEDFTQLARVSRQHWVLVTAKNSTISSIEQLLEVTRTRPLVIAGNDIGSSAFLMQPVVANLLALELALVPGYDGVSARVMALLRDEVDLVLGNTDSLRGALHNGQLQALAQINMPSANQAGADYHELPQLQGQEGLAAQQARANGRNADQAVEQAALLADIAQLGRLIVAPAGLPPGLTLCLSAAIIEVVSSEKFLEAAERALLSIDHADADQARELVSRASEAVLSFQPLILENVRQMRGN